MFPIFFQYLIIFLGIQKKKCINLLRYAQKEILHGNTAVHRIFESSPTTQQPVKFELQMKSYFFISISMNHAMFGT